MGIYLIMGRLLWGRRHFNKGRHINFVIIFPRADFSCGRHLMWHRRAEYIHPVHTCSAAAAAAAGRHAKLYSSMHQIESTTSVHHHPRWACIQCASHQSIVNQSGINYASHQRCRNHAIATWPALQSASHTQSPHLTYSHHAPVRSTAYLQPLYNFSISYIP